MQVLPLHAVVATLEDVPSLGIVRGQVGAVVFVYSTESVEVEFVDAGGQTYAMGTLDTANLVELHHEPLRKAA